MKNDSYIKFRFNHLRNKLGLVLIDLTKKKIDIDQWHKYLSKDFSDEEMAFLLGSNINQYVKNKSNKIDGDYNIDLGKGSRFELRGGVSKLLISPRKAALLTWVCTDGHMEIRERGYYIKIRDNDPRFLYNFQKLINSIYGEQYIAFKKIKNKNASEAVLCSKEIVADLITYIPLSKSREWTIPIELLNDESAKAVLRILSQTEGSVFLSDRTRNIEICLCELPATEVAGVPGLVELE